MIFTQFICGNCDFDVFLLVQRGHRDDYLDEDEDYSRRPPRKGWATPTYEEMLEKKRREERRYR